MATTAPGISRHFKGGRYRILHIAKSATDESEQVVYVSLDYGTMWVRSLAEWHEPTDRWPDGVTRPRFVPEESLGKEILAMLPKRG